MRQLIYWFLGAVTFIFVATSTIWKQAVSLSLCGILGFNSVTCHGWFLNSRVNAAVPKSGVEIAQVDIFDNKNDGNSKPNNGNVDIFKKPNPNSDLSQPNRNSGKNQSSPDNAIDDAAKNVVSPPSNPSVQSIRDEFQSPIYVYYVNGIRTDNTGYADDVNLISSRLLNGIVDPPKIDVPTHNPTGLISKVTGFGDLFESLRQILDAPRPDSEAITNTILEAIKKRDKEKSEEAKKSCKDKKRAKFLIIGHSQGNFFLQDIAQKLPQEFADRTVLLSFASFTDFRRISGRIRSFYPLLRPDDFPTLSNGILDLVHIPGGTPNLPALPTLISYQNQPSLSGTNGLIVKPLQALDSHSLKNYLGNPTHPDYAAVTQRSLEMARANLGGLLNFDSGKYEKKKDCSEQALKTGKSYGDPHIITFDGYRYSFQMVGEFTLVKAKDNSFEIQVRQGAVPGSQLSLNTGAAMKVGNTRVAFYSKDFPDTNKNTQLRVDGKPTVVEGSLSLPGGGVITRSGGDYVVIWPTGEQVTIHNITVAGSTFMNVIPAVPDQSDRYIGLLGNLNSDPNDDLRTRSGKIVPTKNNSTYGQLSTALNNLLPVPVALSKVETLFFDQLYKEFGDSWRINQSESLFDYASGQSTDTFTKRGFPNNYISLSSFLPPQLRKAEEICQRAGVSGDLLDGCIFDVANTGEAGFAQAAADAVTGIVKDKVQQEIRNRIPVNIPGLPF
jgi:hypothetical protein